MVLPERRDQVNSVEARTMLGLPDRGWRDGEDITLPEKSPEVGVVDLGRETYPVFCFVF